MKKTTKQTLSTLKANIERAIGHISGIDQDDASYKSKKACRYAINTIRKIEADNGDYVTIIINDEYYESLKTRMADAKSEIVRHQMTIGTTYALNAIETAIEMIDQIMEADNTQKQDAIDYMRALVKAEHNKVAMMKEYGLAYVEGYDPTEYTNFIADLEKFIKDHE